MEKIKKHFEEEAREFEQIILKLIPYYEEMIEALITSIPFEEDRLINVIDLGCGTGTIAKRIKNKYENSKVTCVDLAKNMIEMAKSKLADYTNIEFVIEDFYNFDFKKTYDVVVSSLALHHLRTDDDKVSFYKKIYNCMNSNGVFFNADVVLASNNLLQHKYLGKWIAYMNKQMSKDEIENKWIPKYYDEDRPAGLLSQLKWLEEIGFYQPDVIWKYYNFAVYGAYKK